MSRDLAFGQGQGDAFFNPTSITSRHKATSVLNETDMNGRRYHLTYPLWRVVNTTGLA